MSSLRHQLETAVVILSWFVLNISIGSLTKWTYLYGQICVLGDDCVAYKFPLAITVIHMAFSYLFCGVFLRLRRSSRKGQESPRSASLETKGFSLQRQVRKIAPLAACFAMSVAMGNLSLKYIFPSFNQMLGAMSPIITVGIDAAFMKKKYNRWTWLSMPVICGGLILCSLEEINFDALGCFYATGATILRSVKSLIQNKLLVDPSEKLDSVSLLFYMAPWAGGFLWLASLCSEGAAPISIFFRYSPAGEALPATGIPSLLGLLIISGLNACFLNIANFLVTSYTNAVMLQVLGNVKSCLAIAISVMIFGNPLLPSQGIGVAICLFGVWLYNNKGGSAQAPPAVRPIGSASV